MNHGSICSDIQGSQLIVITETIQKIRILTDIQCGQFIISAIKFI